jgi:hypothetical protein
MKNMKNPVARNEKSRWDAMKYPVVRNEKYEKPGGKE